MAKSEAKLKAIALRRKGISVKDIAKQLGVSKSSASIWTRDIVLTSLQRKILNARQIVAGHRGRMRGTEKNKLAKQERIQRAQEDAQRKLTSLSHKDLYFLGLGLYWGEGVKASNGTVAVVNSDYRVIQLMMRWFVEYWDVEPTRFHPRVFISDLHKDREGVVTRFWVKALGIPKQQFRRMVFLNKGKKIYENRDMYYGVLTLRIAKGSELRHRILADIARVADIGIKPA